MLARNVVLVALAIAGCNAHPLADVPLTTASEQSGWWFAPPLLELDLLVIVDDSASMVDEADSIASLLEAFGSPDVEYDLRVGVTTTDTGNPACKRDTMEDGALVATSCRERLEDFATPGDVDGDAADVGASACFLPCSLAALDLPVPWIEHAPGRSNLPPGVSFEDAAACIVPQGVSGCAFESPLHAMRRVLERSMDPSAPELGFRRADASLAVLFVTDEDDCSVASGHEAAFDPANEPTSATCLEEADALVEIDDSVRLLRYIEEIAEPVEGSVLVGAIVGENDRVDHPPPRLLEFLSHFEYAEVSSPGSYIPLPLFGWGDTIRPLCVEACVADDDLSAPDVQPSCWLERRRDDVKQPLPRCELAGEEWTLPLGATTCWAPLVDKDGVTDSTADDMSMECIEEGWNLEVRIVSTERRPYDVLHWTCELADTTEVACPEL